MSKETIVSNAENDTEAEYPKPLKVALLGAGIFATNSHARILRDNPKVC